MKFCNKQASFCILEIILEQLESLYFQRYYSFFILIKMSLEPKELRLVSSRIKLVSSRLSFVDRETSSVAPGLSKLHQLNTNNITTISTWQGSKDTRDWWCSVGIQSILHGIYVNIFSKVGFRIMKGLRAQIKECQNLNWTVFNLPPGTCF